MKSCQYLLIVLFMLAAWSVHGAGDPVSGKEKAAVCFGCHGEDGNSANPRYPKLSGQLAGYIVKQTLDFKNGRRRDDIMSAMINIIPQPTDMEDVGAYFASQEVMQGDGKSDETVARGKELFIVERCTFCHGEGAKPTGPFVPGAPVIGGQHKEYLVKVMQEFKAGTRQGDIYGWMGKTLKRLSDDDLEAIATFLSSL